MSLSDQGSRGRREQNVICNGCQGPHEPEACEDAQRGRERPSCPCQHRPVGSTVATQGRGAGESTEQGADAPELGSARRLTGGARG